MDFEERHRKSVQDMAFCGHKEDLITSRGITDALAIIATAAHRTIDDDLRAEEPFLAALVYLERRTTEERLITLIRRSLDVQNPYQRAHQLSQLVHELRTRPSVNPEIYSLPGQA